MLGVEKGSLHALICCHCKRLQESLRLIAMLRLLQTINSNIVDEFACFKGGDLCDTDMYAHTAKDTQHSIQRIHTVCLSKERLLSLS